MCIRDRTCSDQFVELRPPRTLKDNTYTKLFIFLVRKPFSIRAHLRHCTLSMEDVKTYQLSLIAFKVIRLEAMQVMKGRYIISVFYACRRLEQAYLYAAFLGTGRRFKKVGLKKLNNIVS